MGQQNFRAACCSNSPELTCNCPTRWLGELEEHNWRNEAPSETERGTIDLLKGRKALYRRVRYDERIIELGSERMIGSGAAECERLWHENHVDDKPILTISRIDRPTCHLERDDEGVWRGAWLEHERMPIELIPFAQWQSTTERVVPTKPRLIITIAIGTVFEELHRLVHHSIACCG